MPLRYSVCIIFFSWCVLPHVLHNKDNTIINRAERVGHGVARSLGYFYETKRDYRARCEQGKREDILMRRWPGDGRKVQHRQLVLEVCCSVA